MNLHNHHINWYCRYANMQKGQIIGVHNGIFTTSVSLSSVTVGHDDRGRADEEGWDIIAVWNKIEVLPHPAFLTQEHVNWFAMNRRGQVVRLAQHPGSRYIISRDASTAVAWHDENGNTGAGRGPEADIMTIWSEDPDELVLPNEAIGARVTSNNGVRGVIVEVDWTRLHPYGVKWEGDDSVQWYNRNGRYEFVTGVDTPMDILSVVQTGFETKAGTKATPTPVVTGYTPTVEEWREIHTLVADMMAINIKQFRLSNEATPDSIDMANPTIPERYQAGYMEACKTAVDAANKVLFDHVLEVFNAERVRVAECLRAILNKTHKQNQ